MGSAELDRDKRFKSDVVFNLINKKYITLKDEDRKVYAIHLQNVLESFVLEMKKIDRFFRECYQRIAYVGSYYEGLKVGMPDEFDLNIIINLPINYNSTLKFITLPNNMGNVIIQAIGNVEPLFFQAEAWSSNADKYKTLKKFFKEPNMLLDQNKFRQWFESVVERTLRSFPWEYGSYIFVANGQKYNLCLRKSGPAFTLHICLPSGGIIDVDLVPALEFDSAPQELFRSSTTEKRWFAIPKPLRLQYHDDDDDIQVHSNSYASWRPSFYLREKEILKGNVKPIIRQMKKLRDTQRFTSIASYYIKVLFLWELEEHQNYSEEFLRWNPTYLFFHMLRKLQQACEKHEILDFWNPRNNLLAHIGEAELFNISCRLRNIIKDIEKTIATDPYSIAKYILTSYQLESLMCTNPPDEIIVEHPENSWSDMCNIF